MFHDYYGTDYIAAYEVFLWVVLICFVRENLNGYGLRCCRRLLVWTLTHKKKTFSFFVKKIVTMRVLMMNFVPTLSKILG